jgi:hypothetical protein
LRGKVWDYERYKAIYASSSSCTTSYKNSAGRERKYSFLSLEMKRDDTKIYQLMEIPAQNVLGQATA